MKLTFLFLTLILSSFSALAAGPCGEQSSCVEKSNYWPLSSQGTYYARGTGNNCEQALQDAKNSLAENFDHLLCKDCNRYGNVVIRCGASNGRPFLWNQTCLRNKRTGEVIAWAQCDNNKISSKPIRRNSCTMIQGVLMC